MTQTPALDLVIPVNREFATVEMLKQAMFRLDVHSTKTKTVWGECTVLMLAADLGKIDMVYDLPVDNGSAFDIEVEVAIFAGEKVSLKGKIVSKVKVGRQRNQYCVVWSWERTSEQDKLHRKLVEYDRQFLGLRRNSRVS